MALPRPRISGPFGNPPKGPGLGSITLRLGIGATALSVALILFQVKHAQLARPEAGPGGEAQGVTGTAEPVAVTGTAESTTLTAARLETPPPRDPRLVPFHGLLDGVTDFEDVAMNRPYAFLAEHVRRLTDDEAKRNIRADLDFAELVKAPHLARGEIVQVDGLLIRIEPVRLVPGIAPPGIEDAWRGWLLNPDLAMDECWVFDLIGDPPPISDRDIVRVEGAFLKVIRFDTKEARNVRDAKGDIVVDAAGKPVKIRTRDAPFLIARRAWRPTEDEIERSFRYDYVIVILVGVVAVFFLVQRKRSADEQSILEARRAELERKLKKRTGEA